MKCVFSTNWGRWVDYESLLPLIERIYDTALASENWGAVLDEVSEIMGARGAIIFEVVEAEKRLIAPYFSQNYVVDEIRNYLEHFGSFEYQNQLEFAKIASDSPGIELINDSDVETHAQDDRMRLARAELARRYKLGHRTGTILNKDSWNIDRFALQYDARRGPATDEEKAKGKILFPHLAKALRIGRPIIDQTSREMADFRMRMDRLDFGIALVTERAELLLHNREFERILSENDAIRLSPNKVLEIKNPDALGRFGQMLASIQAHGQAGANPRAQAITIIGRGVNRDSVLFIEVSPLKFHPALGQLPEGARLVTCLDASRAHEIDANIVGAFFSLTAAERDILKAIAHGHSNANIAEMRSRSIETINSQTKALLRKTHTRNRTELVQLSIAMKSPFSMAWF